MRETATFIGPSHASKQSIITRSWINVQTATKAFADDRGLTWDFHATNKKPAV